MSKHRKLQPTAAERVVWSQGEETFPRSEEVLGEASRGEKKKGDNMSVVPTEVGRVGGLICWESECFSSSEREYLADSSRLHASRTICTV